MREHGMAASIFARLAADGDQRFADASDWMDHLRGLGVSELKTTPDPVRLATEGALWGAVKAHGFRLPPRA